MSFRVDPEVLKAIAGRYEASAEHIAAARDYNLTYSDLEWYQVGLIVGLNSLHNDFAEVLRQRLAQAVTLLAASSEHLRMAADSYSRTDGEAAARLDATYPAVVRPDTGKPRER